RQFDFAELAGQDELDGLPHAGVAAALGAGLANAVEFAGELDDAPALADVVADGFFDVHVLAGLEGPDGGEGVPVVGRGDADDVDGLVVHDPAEVLFKLGGLVLGPFRALHRFADDFVAGVAVADRGHDTVVLAGKAADVVVAPAVDADDGHAQLIVG